ncbi:MAG: hypothetical protein Tsb009_31550 [Planctomycetaceae bacterium]
MSRECSLVIGIVGWAILFCLPGCGEKSVDGGETVTVVYLCKETKKVVRAPLQPSPAVNPETGRKTLYRALYCSKCKKWHAIPPGEERSGNPLRYRCPKHHSAMSADGPVKK